MDNLCGQEYSLVGQRSYDAPSLLHPPPRLEPLASNLVFPLHMPALADHWGAASLDAAAESP